MASTHSCVLALSLLTACGAPDGASPSLVASSSGSVPVAFGEPTDCALPRVVAFSDLASHAKLPDLFRSAQGERISRKAQWRCQRTQLAALVEQYELGAKPAPPASVTARSNGTAIEVTVSDGGRTIVFEAAIAKPAGAGGPYPAMIGIGGVSLDSRALRALGVAVINFDADDMAAAVGPSSRGCGKFYDLYGENHDAGAMMAWAWGVSRLIDALEKTPAAGIDTRRLGVTGCSQRGRGALVAGAFDERIALTIPQESGAGGVTAWRISEAERRAGRYVPSLSEVSHESSWFRSSFEQFGDDASKLPFDHHQLLGLVAPRGLLVIENTSLPWLGNQSSYLSAAVARRAWQALGAEDAMGVSQVGHHRHCDFPESQQPEVTAYVKRYLLGEADVDTRVMRTDGGFSTDERTWVDWTTPSLE